jgi:hypothetical protein
VAAGSDRDSPSFRLSLQVRLRQCVKNLFLLQTLYQECMQTPMDSALSDDHVRQIMTIIADAAVVVRAEEKYNAGPSIPSFKVFEKAYKAYLQHGNIDKPTDFLRT